MTTAKLDELKLWDRNYNKGDVKAIKASIRRFGFNNAIRVWRGVVVAGNHSTIALRELQGEGWLPSGGALIADTNQWQVRIVDVSHLPKIEAEAFAIADNRTAQLATPDNQSLLDLLEDIRNQDASLLEALSYTQDDIDLLTTQLAPLEMPSEGDSPTPKLDQLNELNDKWQVNTGDVWLIPSKDGKRTHRLMCGDSTSANDAKTLMQDEIAELLFTSPPYSDLRDYDNANVSVDYLANFIPTFKQYARFQAVNLGIIFREHAVIPYWQTYIDTANGAGLKLLAWNVWDKTKAGSVAHQTAMFTLAHEWIFVFGESSKNLNRTVPNDMEAYEKRNGKGIGSIKKIVGQRDTNGEITYSQSPTYTHHQLHSVVQHPPPHG